MRIVRRIGINAYEEERRQLALLGVELPVTPGTPSAHEVFLLDEADDRWPAVRDWFVERGKTPGVAETIFTKTEIEAARWLELQPSWHHGYPQPEEGMAYQSTTYDGRACPQCGTGATQRAPFEMRDEPRWGTRGILQLNWVFGEYFTKPEIAAWLRERFGIHAREVLGRRGTPLRTVAQIVIDDVVSMPAADLIVVVCTGCGVPKIEPIRRGPMRQLSVAPVGHIARTREWFGSGHSAFHSVVISNELRRAFEAARIRGVTYRPVADGPWTDPRASGPGPV